VTGQLTAREVLYYLYGGDPNRTDDEPGEAESKANEDMDKLIELFVSEDEFSKFLFEATCIIPLNVKVYTVYAGGMMHGLKLAKLLLEKEDSNGTDSA
jgi:hypothetical protein